MLNVCTMNTCRIDVADTYFVNYRYTVQLSGSSVSRVINHNSDSTRVVTTWTRLSPQQSYTFTIICKIQGEQCPGIPSTFTVSTTRNCPGRCELSCSDNTNKLSASILTWPKLSDRDTYLCGSCKFAIGFKNTCSIILNIERF